MSEPLTISAAAPLIRTGELTPSELLEQCLRRIDIYEPAVKAWVYLDRERARQEAAKATDEIKANNYRGPLHGIPIGIKDIIDVYDMPTGCGSKLWANSYARQDATCVERLRQAGAVILGKTVTTAYAYLDPPVTRNPWNLDRTPGGSSSGSAAAVACGMCLAALGTQTGGSTIRPASYCGVYALKPTHGRISVHGVLPLAPSLDHVGVMANCVRDLAVVFEVIAGHDFRQPDGTVPSTPDCLRHVDATLDGSRWYDLQFDFLGGDFLDRVADEVGTHFERLRQLLKDRQDGDRIAVGSQSSVPFTAIRGFHGELMAAEAAAVHAERMARHPDDYPPRIADLIQTGQAVSGPRLRTVLDVRLKMKRQLDDAGYPYPLVCPATPALPPDAATTGDPRFNSPWSFLGLPVVSVPVGWSADGLPVAVQVVGGDLGEKPVFDHAAYIEKLMALPHRLPPVPAA